MYLTRYGITRLACVMGLCALPLWVSTAQGQTLGGLMSHVEIGVTGNQVLIYKDDPALIPAMIGPDAFEAPFSVLNGKGYNAQFGWTALFPFDLHGDLVWVRVVDQSDGLQTFEGGWAQDSGTGIPDPQDQSMIPIFNTFGASDIWSWSGSMTHNWYAATEPGDYFATYEVYVGDALGTMNTTYTPAQVTFEFTNAIQTLYGDLNSDGYVGLDDLQIILDNWNQTTTQGDPLTGDPSGDGYVGLDDLGPLLDNWNAGTPPLPPPDVVSAVPEPATGLVWIGVAMGIAACRRRNVRFLSPGKRAGVRA